MGDHWTKPDTWIRPRRIVRVTALRSTIATDVQLVCGAGPYHLDVLVREVQDTNDLEFSGLITEVGHTDEPVKDLPITLVRGRPAAELAVTETDEYGEFELTGSSRDLFGIRLGSCEDCPCVLVWEGVD